MLVFIDESGDAGFKIGSSDYLVIALVIFDDYSEADKCRDAISKLKKNNNIKTEYKFSSTKDKHKDCFFEEVNKCCFRVRAIVIKKSDIHSDYLRMNPNNFYNFVLKNLIIHSKIKDAKIRIDGKGNKKFIDAAKVYLRKEAPQGMIHKLKYIDSRTEPLIQLSDMIVGAIAREYNRHQCDNSDRWKQIIIRKIEDIWHFR
jgi:hypothetical protein